MTDGVASHMGDVIYHEEAPGGHLSKFASSRGGRHHGAVQLGLTEETSAMSWASLQSFLFPNHCPQGNKEMDDWGAQCWAPCLGWREEVSRWLEIPRKADDFFSHPTWLAQTSHFFHLPFHSTCTMQHRYSTLAPI
jgi:hypothetical protein